LPNNDNNNNNKMYWGTLNVGSEKKTIKIVKSSTAAAVSSGL
jgi:hypothetical protein